MRTNTKIRAAGACWPRRLLDPIIALFGFALAGLATAAPSHPHAALPTSYRVVTLSGQPFVYGVDINATGQVAFTVAPGSEFLARYYDGSRFYDIGGPGSSAQAVNNLGQVTGSFRGGAYRWSVATGLVNIDTTTQDNSGGNAINEKGHIAGGAWFDGTDEPLAFLWTPKTGMRSLGTLGGRSGAAALNESGTVVGFSRNVPRGDNTTNIAFRWTAAEGMRPLGTLPSLATRASDINEAGYIVGTTPVVAGGLEHAFLWTPKWGLRDLGTGTGNRSEALRINDKGMVMGNLWGRRGGGIFNHGFVWTWEHGLVEIGVESPNATANDLNAHGQVVGTFGDRAFIWTRATGTIDLNTRIPDAPAGLELREARAISDNGSIVVNSSAGVVLLVPNAPASHQAPVLGPIALTGTARVHSLLSFSASFKDTDRHETHKAIWYWGDGSKDPGVVSEKYGSGSVSAQHVYHKAGTYTVKLIVTDSGGKSTTVQRTIVVCGTDG